MVSILQRELVIPTLQEQIIFQFLENHPEITPNNAEEVVNNQLALPPEQKIDSLQRIEAVCSQVLWEAKIPDFKDTPPITQFVITYRALRQLAEELPQASIRLDESLASIYSQVKAALGDATLPDNHGQTTIEKAAIRKHPEAIRLLIAMGADINLRDQYGRTALHRAVHQKNTEEAKILIAAGVDVHLKDNSGVSALHTAAQTNNIEIVEALLDQQANVDDRDNAGNTPLHKAAINQHLDIMNVLIEANAAINMQNESGKTPLHEATFFKVLNSIKVLISAGADVDIQDMSGDTPLHHMASCSYNPEIMRDFMNAQPDLTLKNKMGWTALHLAVHHNNKKMVQNLLAAGANPSMPTTDGRTALQIAQNHPDGIDPDIINMLYQSQYQNSFG